MEVEFIFPDLKVDMLKISRSAGKRALTHAFKIGTKEVRRIYTVKRPSSVSRKMMISQAGATLIINGSRLPIERFRHARRKKGIYASIKRGSGGIIARSFFNNKYYRRIRKSRYPIAKLTGLSLPQMYGNEEVMEVMRKSALEKYIERVRHEIIR